MSDDNLRDADQDQEVHQRRRQVIDEFILWNQKQSSDAFIKECGECVPEGYHGRGCIYDPYRKVILHLDRHPSTGRLMMADESSALAKASTRLYLGSNHHGGGDCRLRTVEVCGCFDHLHPRHQVLLQHAFWMAGKGLFVTVTESPSSNGVVEYGEVYQSLSVRIEAIKSFLTELNGKRNLKIVVLSDRERMKHIDDEVIDLQVWGSEYYGYFLARKAVFFPLACESHSVRIRQHIVAAQKLAEAKVWRKYGVFGV
jgi:hypothetical protein